MNIPFINLKRQYQDLKKEFKKAQEEVFKKGVFVLGEQLERFEEEFASYLGAKYCLGVDSGTSALILAVKALGLGKGDEVITTANSFIATTFAISHNQATPVLVDCDNFYNIDVDKIEEKITKKTKALLVVHLYGQPCQMEKIKEIAKKYKLYVIEDCAQAHGARINVSSIKYQVLSIKNKKIPNTKYVIPNTKREREQENSKLLDKRSYIWRKAGTIGDIGCFSFYPTKNLGCFGDGGAVVTNNKKIRDKVLLLRNYGQKKKYFHDILGYNNRLDELQAAFLRIKLKYLDKWNVQRRRIAEKYDQALSSVVITPQEIKDAYHIYHLYVIRTKRRDKLHKFLKEKGITTLIHYPVPIHLQRVYSDLAYKRGDFPKSERFAKKVLSVPIFPEMREEEIRYLINTISEFFS